MRQQVTDGEPWRVGRGVSKFPQLRNVAIDPIIERQLALIAQTQNCERREALGHRGDTEHTVWLHGCGGRHITHARDPDVCESPIDDDAPGCTRHMLTSRELLHQLIDGGKRRGQTLEAGRVGKLRRWREVIRRIRRRCLLQQALRKKQSGAAEHVGKQPSLDHGLHSHDNRLR